MISRPTTPQLIEAACTELEAKVAPELGDGPTQVVLAMAIAVLRGAAVRSAYELGWMRQEADAIEQVAEVMVGAQPDATALAAALQEYRERRSDGRFLDDALADYERASDVLSLAIELAYGSGDPIAKAEVDALMAQRMANENAVIGEFQAAGRT